MKKGLIFDVQRFSLHDGPGLRTLIFFKGCPLKCRWCSNPESHSGHQEIMFDARKCRACGECATACQSGALTRDSEGHVVYRRELCILCGHCVEACPQQARRLVGRRVAIDELLAEIERDAPFFRRSGGGVTLGGGEPLRQAAFAQGLLKACRDRGIHTALETSGHAAWPVVLRTSRLVDLIFFDIKHIDPTQHEHLTGLDNRAILSNLERLCQVHTNILVRYPLVPGCNDGEGDILAMARYVKSLERLSEVEIIPYHRYGEVKYDMLGREYLLAGLSIPSPEELALACELIRSQGLRCQASH